MLRNIQIRPVLNGFLLNVGCQELAYTDTNKLLGDLGDYLRNPEDTEKRIIETDGFNRKHTLSAGTDLPVPTQDICSQGEAAIGTRAGNAISNRR
ncbi:MAG: hypothetical protein WAW39_28970 [Prosthecobacter sp.]|uniref:hypothetical protein n=1 Tax=Prosthecobacter sp. TaxID=1965333 RepID=UPI003BB1DE5F